MLNQLHSQQERFKMILKSTVYKAGTRTRTFTKSGTWTFRKSGPYAKIHSIG